MSNLNINIIETENDININISKDELLKYFIESNEDIFEFDLTHADELIQDLIVGISKHMGTEEFFEDVYQNCDVFERDCVKRV